MFVVEHPFRHSHEGWEMARAARGCDNLSTSINQVESTMCYQFNLMYHPVFWPDQPMFSNDFWSLRLELGSSEKPSWPESLALAATIDANERIPKIYQNISKSYPSTSTSQVLGLWNYIFGGREDHHDHWLVVWNMAFIFTYIGNHHPNWRTHIFQRGRSTTNQIL